MKFLHTSDLHIGRKLFELSMLEEQENMLDRIWRTAVEEAVDAVVIAGDIYDRAVPSAEAVVLMDEFLTRLVQSRITVIMISGNHDCGERVAFADRILEQQGIYIAGTWDGKPKEVTLKDQWGSVCFVCLPFVKPSLTDSQNSAQAVDKMLSGVIPADTAGETDRRRYVLVTHYFVTGESGVSPELSDSETTLNVGGLDNVPVSLFEKYSYVALGHIHKSQKMGANNVWYSGSPLKYSFSEALSEKTLNLVEMDADGAVSVKRKVICPLHDMRCIRGKLADLVAAAEELPEGKEDYLQVTLTNDTELLDPMSTLRSVYPNVLQILLERNESNGLDEYETRLTGRRKSIEELFGEFYEMLRGETMDEERRLIAAQAAEEARNG